jgi:hypothetical protein
LDIHKEYVLAGGQNAAQEWMMQPRRISMERFQEWAIANLREGDAVVLRSDCSFQSETTTNVWDIYDIVAPLVSRTVVAHAGAVRQIAEARVKTDKEDVKRLIRLLIADIVPEVWGAAGGSARVARDDLVSQSIGQDQHDTCTCVLVQV